MGRKRRQFSSQFKFTVALEAAKGLKTVNEIASEYNVHPTQVGTWKRQLLAVTCRSKRLARRSCMNRSVDSRWNWSGSKKSCLVQLRPNGR